MFSVWKIKNSLILYSAIYCWLHVDVQVLVSYETVLLLKSQKTNRLDAFLNMDVFIFFKIVCFALKWLNRRYDVPGFQMINKIYRNNNYKGKIQTLSGKRCVCRKRTLFFFHFINKKGWISFVINIHQSFRFVTIYGAYLVKDWSSGQYERLFWNLETKTLFIGKRD